MGEIFLRPRTRLYFLSYVMGIKKSIKTPCIFQIMHEISIVNFFYL